MSDADKAGKVVDNLAHYLSFMMQIYTSDLQQTDREAHAIFMILVDCMATEIYEYAMNMCDLLPGCMDGVLGREAPVAKRFRILCMNIKEDSGRRIFTLIGKWKFGSSFRLPSDFPAHAQTIPDDD